MGKITIEDGATWKSILPNKGEYDTYGYMINNSDGTHSWYDKYTIGSYAGESTSINNAGVKLLPVTSEPQLKLDNQTMAEESTVDINKPLVFSFNSWVTDGWGGKGLLYIQKQGASAPEELSAKGDADEYVCDPKTFDFSDAGTYEVWATVSKDGYTRTSKKHTLIVAANLENAEITLERDTFTCQPWNDGTFGKMTATIKTVTLFGKDVPQDAYTVSGNEYENAGSYNLAITAKEGSGYSGSGSVSWKILPSKLAYILIDDRVKQYDGTIDITLENSVFGNAENDFYCPDFGASGGNITLKKDKDYEITIDSSTFDVPQAGMWGTVTYTVKLLNPNFIFNNGTDTKTFTSSHSIGVAEKLPDGYEPNEGNLVVRNGVEASYTFDVSKMLKTLPRNLYYDGARQPKPYYYLNKYGNNGASLINLDSNYYTNGASIDENGILTLPINAVTSDTEGSIGTVKIRVQTQNYDYFLSP